MYRNARPAAGSHRRAVGHVEPSPESVRIDSWRLPSEPTRGNKGRRPTAGLGAGLVGYLDFFGAGTLREVGQSCRVDSHGFASCGVDDDNLGWQIEAELSDRVFLPQADGGCVARGENKINVTEGDRDGLSR